MDKERRSALIILAALIIATLALLLFSPRPIVKDATNVNHIMIFYNPYYDQKAIEEHNYGQPADSVLIVHDEYEIAKGDDGFVVNDDVHNFISGGNKRLVVADYDEKELAECLSRYKAYLTPFRTGSFWMGDVQLELHVFSEDGTDTSYLRLGNTNCDIKNNWEHGIINADKLLAELLDMIEIKRIIEADPA